MLIRGDRKETSGGIYGFAMEQDGLSLIIVSQLENPLVYHGQCRQNNIVCKNIVILIGAGLALKMVGITKQL